MIFREGPVKKDTLYVCMVHIANLNTYLHLYRVIVPEKQTDKAPLLIIPNCTYIEQIFVKEKLKTILWLTVHLNMIRL